MSNQYDNIEEFISQQPNFCTLQVFFDSLAIESN